MKDFSKELAEWKTLFEEGQIDEATYLAEISRLSRLEDEQKNNEVRSNKVKKEAAFKFIEIIKAFWLQILVFIFIICVVAKVNTPKEYEIVKSLGELPDPVQENLLGGRVEKVVFGKNVDIIYGAEYTIYGRVIGTFSPMPTNIRDSLSPMDIALSWGFLAQDTYDHEVIYTSLPSRFLRFQIYDMSVFSSVGGMNAVGNHLSNNHVIPKDSKIKTLLKKVKVDDFIKLEGYLVTAQVEGQSRPVLQSSAVRSDSGAGACEVMYVTGIKWLKEK